MGLFDELRRLARPYEDEPEDDYEDDFEPVSRSERMDRTGGDRLERKSAKSLRSPPAASILWITSAAATRWSTSTPPPSCRWCW